MHSPKVLQYWAMQNFVRKFLGDKPVPVVEFQRPSRLANDIERRWKDLREALFQGQSVVINPAVTLLEEDLINLKDSHPRSNYAALLMHFYLMTNQFFKAGQVFDEWVKQTGRKGYREGDWAPIAGITQVVSPYRQETLYLEIAALLQLHHQFDSLEKFYAFLEKIMHENKKKFTDEQFKLLNDRLAFLPERAEALAQQLSNQAALIP